MEFEIEIFRSLEEAEESWREFQEKGELYVFQSLEWQKNLQDAWKGGYPEDILIVKITKTGGSPYILLPLEIRKRGGLNILGWLGGDFIDYGAPIICRDESAEDTADGFGELWDEILSRLHSVDAVWLKKIPRRIGGALNPMLSLGCDRYHTRGYFTKLTGDWERFFKAHAGPKTRSTARRKSRRLEEMGELRFRVTDGSDGELLSNIAKAMVEQKRTRYREIGAPDFLATPASRRFFTHPVPDLLDSGILNLSCLSLDGRIITAHWGMAFRGRYYYYMPSFEQGPWLRFSPGEILLTELIKWSMEEGLDIFDLTIGDEEYKKRWRDNSIELFQRFSALSAKGKGAKLLYLTYRLAVSNPLLLGAARKLKRSLWRFKHSLGGKS